MRLLPLPGVFRPPSDSWMLARCIRQEQLPPHARVLDLCTGSGLLALTAADAGARTVTAVDISRRAVFAVRVNAKLNGLEVEAVRGDLLDAVAGERFDLIACNPPYVPSAEDEIPMRGLRRAWEGGRDGRAFIERICERASEHLRPDGVLLLVHSSACDEQQTLRSLANAGLQAEVAFRHRGRLGPLMRARLPMLRERGLLHEDAEETLVIRATAPGVATAHSASDPTGGEVMAKDHGPSVKNDKQYEALRKQGMSKSRAAAISNSPGSSSRGGKKSGSSGGSSQSRRSSGRGSGGNRAQKAAAGRKGGKAS